MKDHIYPVENELTTLKSEDGLITGQLAMVEALQNYSIEDKGS